MVEQANIEASAKKPMMGGAFNVFESEAKMLVPYLPADLVGGSVPYVPGHEDEAVWNASAQACGTERVYYCYTIENNQCWYLAAPAASFASHPDSWCPLAAALPGNSEFWDKQTVYVYEQEGSAGAIRWDRDTGRMQVYLGATRTILPRLQAMETNFVSIKADKAKPVRWFSRSLNQEKLSRVLTRILMFAGLGVTMISIGLWAMAFMMSSVLQPNLDSARKLSEQATMALMVEASGALQSDSHRHMARIQQLLDTLVGFGGTIVKYQITGGSVEWEALVPRALEGNLSQLNATAVGLDKDGRLRIKGSS